MVKDLTILQGRLKYIFRRPEADRDRKNTVTSAYAVKRSYGYDRTGNLPHSTDQRTGTTRFEYDKLGRITKAGSEVFAFNPTHNILSDNNSPTVQDNRLKEYNGSSYITTTTSAT